MTSDGCRSPDGHQRIINESLELLYGDHKDVIIGVNQLCKSELLEDIVQNHQLMSALSRLLGDDTNRPIEVLFLLEKLFLSLSMLEDFHQILLNQRVGALTLAVVDLEVKRAQQRVGTDSTSMPSNQKGSTFSGQLYFSKQQGRVLFICLSILNNLADDSAVLKKMIKRSLFDLVIQCIPPMSTQTEHLLVALSLLKKTSAIVDRDVLKVESIVRLTFLLSITQNGALCEVVITLFNLSFHQECIDLISADEKIHSQLMALLSNHFICNYSLKLLYHLSSRQDFRQKLHEAGITPCLIELLTYVEELDESFAGLLVNMTLHPLCCEEWMRLVGIEPVLRIMKKSQRVETKQILLKVSRNLSRWTNYLQCKVKLALVIQDASPLTGIVRDPEAIIHRPYLEYKFWYGHAHQIIQSMLTCENDDLLVEWMGLINNLTCDDLPADVQWINQLDNNKDRIIYIFDKLHDSRCHDDIKLELIILFGKLCSIKECCEWVASTGLLDVIHSVFVETSDPEIRLQILFIYERCLVCEVTWSHNIDRTGVAGKIVDCLMNEDRSLKAAAERCLLLIEDCDCDTDGVPGPISASIQEMRYEVLMNG